MSAILPTRRVDRRRRRRWPGVLAVVLSLVLLVGGSVLAVTKGMGLLSDRLSSAEDFPGPGGDKVLFEVKEGDTIAAMGRGLKEQGIVKSVDAFTEAASAEPASTGIQVGNYQLRTEMAAADVLKVLVDPTQLVRREITVPEGLRAIDIIDLLAEKSGFKRAAFTKVLADPSAIGLPKQAKGKVEGYLFPATYDFGPKPNPKTMLTAMVDRWKQSAKALKLKRKAKRLGYTPAQVMTIASLIESEANLPDDLGKVSRVIYNRLENPDNETRGKLQLDATVLYALDKKSGVALTADELDVDSPYNTRRYAGLPPGPIESPGDAAIKAALKPTPGPWLYYVTVNLATSETKFTDDYDEFLGFRDELKVYCETSEAC
ncbi:MAG: endolytic transglycosylase MltG [Nocardioides sp.]